MVLGCGLLCGILSRDILFSFLGWHKVFSAEGVWFPALIPGFGFGLYRLLEVLV